MVELAPRSPDVVLASVKVIARTDGTEVPLMPVARFDQQARFELPENRSWRVTCEDGDLWCPELEVNSGEVGRLLLPVAKRTYLRGTVRAAAGHQPTEVNIQGWEVRSNAAEALKFHALALVENGRFEVPAPAVLFDLRLAAKGFSPVYLWDLEIGAYEKVQGRSVQNLGSIAFRPGNSLCGFVVESTSGHPLEAAVVKLAMPSPLVGSRAKSVERLDRMAWTTETNARGFFQLIGPPNGTYLLEVQSADPEHELLVVDAVAIVEDAETCLEDLEVQRAFEVGFTINPPQAPEDRSWQVRLTSKDFGGLVEPEEAMAPDVAGRAAFRVVPGSYDLTVTADGIDLTAMKRNVRIDAQDEIFLDLSLVRVEGSIRLGDKPLIAQVHLMGEEGARTMFESDAGGIFGGWVREPKGERLVAEVKAVWPQFSRWLELEVAPNDEGVLELELSFDNRSLTGRVETEGGAPVRKAEVTAVPIGSTVPIRSTTEVDGYFELTGLDDLPYLVRAQAKGVGKSKAVRIEPWGEGSAPDLSLVLHRGRWLEGRLLSAESAAVPAARLTLIVPGTYRWIESTSTDVGGAFEVRIPEGARRAVVQVFGPSQMNWSACVEIPDAEQELDLYLPALPGGRAVLRVASGPMAFSTQTVLVTSEGGILPLSSLASFGKMSESGSREEGWLFEISALASGLYGVVQTRSPLDLAAQSCSGSVAVEEWQQLLPGGEVVLSVNPRQ